MMTALRYIGLFFKSVFGTRPGVPGPGRVLLLSRYTLVSMILGTVPLAVAPQGRDLIVALADQATASEHRFFFYVTLALWGLCVWYWSRVVLDAELAPRAGAAYRGLARHLPRVLGAATMLLPSIPIAFASNTLGVKIAMIAGCAALAGAFWTFVRKRRDWFASAQGAAVMGFSMSALGGTPAAAVAAATFIVSSALFLLFVFAPLATARYLGAVSILFIAAANTVFFGSAAVFISQMFRVRVDLVALTFAALFSFWNDNHDVEVARLDVPLPRLEDQFRAWRAQRPSGSEGPVFLVAAEGGGIRAAFWTATVLGGLSEGETQEFGKRLFAVSGISGGTLGATVYAALRHDFPEGTVDLRRAAQAVLGHDFLSPTLAKLVSGDFLQWFLPFPVRAFDRSTAIQDAFMRAYETERGRGTLGAPITTLWPDARTGVPALVMNTTIVESGGRAAVAPFTWTDAQLPGATIYTCWVMQALSCGSQTYGAPPIANAVHNSARFTYISPAGRVRAVQDPHATLGHVVDAGYFDPTGVETLLDIAETLRTMVGSSTRVVHVYVTNQTVPAGINRAALDAMSERAQSKTGAAEAAATNADESQPKAPNDTAPAAPVEILGELFAPVRALVGTRAAHGRVAIGRQRREVLAVTFGFCPMTEQAPGTWVEQPEGTREEARAKPPLGWQLSVPMRDRLDAYWSNCQANKDGVRVIRALVKGSAGG